MNNLCARACLALLCGALLVWAPATVRAQDEAAPDAAVEAPEDPEADTEAEDEASEDADATTAPPASLEDFGSETRVVLAARPEFRGNKHFNDARLRRLVGLEQDDEMPLYMKDDYARQIEAAYHEAGFPLAGVQAQMRATPGIRAVVLEFRVAEGPRVAVDEIRFEGNESVPEEELLDVMDTHARWDWLPFLRAGRFRRRQFDQDVRKLQDMLYERGYLDAVVGGEVIYNEDKTRVDLRMSVHEGELYRIEDVVFEGNRLFRRDELLAATPLEVGGVYSPAELDRATEKIEDLYARAGHPDVTQREGSLRVTPVIAEEGARVVVRFQVDEGPLVRIGRIRVRGLVRTKESVVRRNLTFYPGEVATSDRFEESRSLLVNSGVFDRSRNAVQIELAPGDEAVRDVIVRVQEGPTANLIFSGGFGSHEGFFGEVSFTEENFDITNWPSSLRDILHGNAFRGAGHKLRLRLYSSQESTNYNLSFLNPSVYNSRYSAGWDLYDTQRSRDEYDEGRIGFSLNGGRRVTKFIHHTVNLGYEKVDVDDVDPIAPADFQNDAGSHDRPFVRYTVRTDRRDNRFLPSEGHFLQGLLEYAAGDVEVARLQVQAEKYFLLHENPGGGRHVLALRGEAGVVESTTGGRTPVFERFFAGGFRSMRGFEYNGVAPVDPTTEIQIGGESMLLGSVEYVLPVKPESFHLLAFADGGYVKRDAEDVFNGWDELRMAVGVGARFSLGAMPGNIEVSFSTPVMEQDGDETQPFQFSFGAGARF